MIPSITFSFIQTVYKPIQPCVDRVAHCISKYARPVLAFATVYGMAELSFYCFKNSHPILGLSSVAVGIIGAPVVAALPDIATMRRRIRAIMQRTAAPAA